MSAAHSRSRWVLILIAVAVGLCPAFILRQGPVEWASYDWRVRHFAPELGASRVTLVTIDTGTLHELDRVYQVTWPFPRAIYGYVMAALDHHGAHAAVYDIIYAETSDYDDAFADSLDRLPSFLATVTDAGTKRSDEADYEDLRWPVTVDGAALPAVAGFKPEQPVPVLAAAAAGGGHIDIAPHADGVSRGIELVLHDGGQTSPTLALAAWMELEGIERLHHDGSSLHIGPIRAPLETGTRTLLPWRVGEDAPGEHGFVEISFKDLVAEGMRLEAGKPPLPGLDDLGERLRERVVFIVPEAAAMEDLRATPRNEEDIGGAIHATAFDALDHGAFIARVPAWLDHLLTFLALAMVAWGCLALKKVWQEVALTVGLMLAWLIAACALYRGGGWWLALTGPELGMFTAFAVGTLGNYLTEGRERRFIRSSFQHYLSPLVVEQLVADPSRLRLGGERRQITAMFTDLAGFTALSESMEPGELVDLLNEYLTEMTDIIMEEGGTVDKYEGDAIIAMFGAPLDQSDHALRACRAAVRCQRKLDELRRLWADRELPPLHMRIGLNSGPAVVGNLGSRQRFDYTMIGDTVNLAARLEGANKMYGTYTMVSGATWELAGGHLIGRQLDLVAVKGKAEGVPVHEVVGFADDPADPARDDLLSAYTEAHRDYLAQEFTRAAAAFERLAETYDDPPSRIFAARCHELAAAPPGPDWDGVYRMTTK